MAFEFKLPDIGEGVVEGELTKWLVGDGEAVSEDTPLFEVLTDKVSAVIPSPRRGTVSKRHFAEGDIVPVGATVLTIDESGGSASATATAAPATAATATPPATPPATPKAAAKAPATPAPAETATTAAAPTPAAPPAAATATTDEPSSNRVRATPATRKLARTLGVDIGGVDGSGEHGRVTKEDVQRANAPAATAVAAPAKAAPAPSPAPAANDEVTRILGLRRKISDRMRHSRDTAAHFSYVEEVDFTAISGLKDDLRAGGLRTTYLPFVMKAVAQVLRRPEFAMINAHVDYAAGTVTRRAAVNLGIATATEAGLMVPVIFDVDRKSMQELIAELAAVAEAARNNAIPVAQLSGSTFTITSLGKIGGMFATPIINQPEVAILGLHKIEKRPVVIDDQIVIRERMYMSSSFDHRIIDGHIGAAFVQEVAMLLEHPARLLAALR